MKSNAAVLTLILSVSAGAYIVCAAQIAHGQDLLSGSDPIALGADPGAGSRS